MNINDLISIVKKKLESNFKIENIQIEDKSFLHKNHAGNFPGKYHLKLKISSKELNKISRIESNKKIFKVLKNELAEYIHSIQILIN
tara:strand:- start:1339 stop:1599 length:261 start_codon:yes stop_codon:yes gene_type:complete